MLCNPPPCIYFRACAGLQGKVLRTAILIAGCIEFGIQKCSGETNVMSPVYVDAGMIVFVAGIWEGKRLLCDEYHEVGEPCFSEFPGAVEQEVGFASGGDVAVVGEDELAQALRCDV